VDPLTLSTVWHSLQRICREMRRLIERTSQSYLISELKDISVGIWDGEGNTVAIPVGLQDAMSRQAQAEREKEARVILGSAEAAIAAKFVEAARTCGGMAIGSRYVTGGEVVGWSPERRLLSWAANLYCRVLLRLRTRDCTSGFRCYTSELLTRIGLEAVVSQGYSFQIEMVFRATRLGYQVVEVPIRFEERVAGESKVSQNEVRRALLTVLRLSLAR